ncbi:hypothetical protein BDY17DRAFT_325005 [Neohortaea acidophila]|uniref:Uncharacterized protein n=1 Tax=Neohortaea acidophila TaxID=245834 RepID=A0A6A6PSI5_9PEZI|nr:uncharacterized protein BDY17DRAFT_325005 [Neohortaea acidophila]KAF2482746.1 hypothetical protein BDY17DRAFT_325005 [Neohortaea acidophila]
MQDSIRQWRLHSPVDEIREALLGFDALHKRRDLRLEVLRSLSNPWPEPPRGPPGPAKSHVKTAALLPEANAAPVPHAIFRQRLYSTLDRKAIRKIIRVQLLRCERPEEILRVIAVAMQNKLVAQNMVVLSEPITRALYRCRKNVSDPQVLRTLNIIVWRFTTAGYRVDPSLLQLGMKFAARSRSLPAMKRYFKLSREAGAEFSSNVFRSVIAKFSIGNRGLGEIRNGRWSREQLLQVLTGFEDERHLPPDQQNHLGTFLHRDSWQYLHGWVAVLARCKDSESVWREWELWKQSPARTHPKKLQSQNPLVTSKVRGDHWFIEQMSLAGDLEKAWTIFGESGMPFDRLKLRVKVRLLEGIEHATIPKDALSDALLNKYDMDLAKIERALGVRWVASDDGEGSHELFTDQEEALETLGADDWKMECDLAFPQFGFPQSDEEGAIVPERSERALHDAEEKGPADGDRAV